MEKAKRTDIVKTTMALPRDLWKRARVRAIDEDRDLQDVVVSAVEEYLRKPLRRQGDTR